MLKQKLIYSFLCIGILSGMTANAEKVEITENSRTVTISENADSALDGMLILAKKGADVDNDENLYAMEYAEAKDGQLIFQFEMQDERSEEISDGEYDFYIRRMGKDTVKGIMIYATVESRKAVVDGINSAESGADIFSLLEASDNLIALRAIGCEIDEYLISDKREDIAELIYEQLSDIDIIGEKQIADYCNPAIAAGNINEKDSIDKYLQMADFVFENVSYTQLTSDDIKKWIQDNINVGKPYNTVTELEEAYAKSIMLYNIKDSRLTEFEDTLKKYADELDISSENAYKKYLNKSNKNKLNENILTALKGEDLLNADKLLEIIGDELDNLSSKGSSGGSSGGGGSSGSSSVGGITTSIPASDEPLKTDVEDKTQAEIRFIDMDQASWAMEAVNILAEKNIIAGDGNGYFNPNNILTREAFVKMLVVVSGTYDENAECDFDDVSKDSWYYRYVASAVNAGLVSGISDTEFGTGRNISRQDMSVICYRAVNKETAPEKIRESAEFADKSDIAAYASEAVDELYMMGVVNGMGDNSFKPLGTATRAQGAMIIYNLFFK